MRVFEQEGVRMEVGGNQPFLLNKPDTVWMVQSGKVDVFVVYVENGEPVGRRRHLMRVAAGQALVGVDAAADQRIGLLAVGFGGTVLLQLPRPRLSALTRNADIRPAGIALLTTWVETLSAGIVPDVPPKNYEILEVDQETTLPAEKNAGPLEGLVWVQHRKGRSRFLGKTPVGENGFFPVSERTWLRTQEDAALYAVTTETYLGHDPAWTGLQEFHRRMLDCLQGDLEREEQQERQRIEERAKADRSTFRRAVSRLATVLDPQAAETLMPPERQDPLLIACRWVGQALGVSIVEPPSTGAALPETGDSLGDIARASKIRTRQVMLRGAWWTRDHGPLLGYIEAAKQPVALIPTSATSYDLMDPVTESRTPVTPELAGTLSPFAYIFYRSLPARVLTGLDLLKLGVRGCQHDLMTVLLMGIAGGLLGLVTPIATGHLVDTIIPESERGQLLQLTGALVISAFSMALFNIVRSIALLRVEGKMNMSVQAAVWDRLLNLPTAFFRRYTAGDLAMRAMGINQMRQIISGVVVSTAISSLFSIFHFGLLFYYAWKLALLAIGLSIVLLGITLSISYYGLRYQRQLAEIEGAVSGMVLQFITGMAKLRVAGAEGRAFAAWSERFSHKKRVAFKAGTIQNYLEAVQSVFPVLASMAVFWMALYLMREPAQAGNAALTTGAFLAFNAAFGTFLNAALEMGMAVIAALSIVPLYKRATPILEALPEISATKAHPGELKGEIEANRLSFSYVEDGPAVLKDVSFHVDPGEYVAIVGPSGSGKSTLLRLLMGFERPTVGSIYYDGHDLEDLDVGEVRRQIGIVLQHSKLRAGSLFQNIVGSAPLTLDDAWEAARMAGLDADIEAMPMGMHTAIDSEGSTLSGGQKQRLMIARAIVRRPRLLFFDEATSALDNQTQTTVSRSLERLQATRIVIAHRLSTIMHADRIYVMKAGEIIQTGTYDELMRQPGPFADLAKRQIA